MLKIDREKLFKKIQKKLHGVMSDIDIPHMEKLLELVLILVENELLTLEFESKLTTCNDSGVVFNKEGELKDIT